MPENVLAQNPLYISDSDLSGAEMFDTKHAGDRKTVMEQEQGQPRVREMAAAVISIEDPFASLDFVIATPKATTQIAFNEVLHGNGSGKVETITFLPGGRNLVTVSQEASAYPDGEPLTALRIWAAPKSPSVEVREVEAPRFCDEVKVSGKEVSFGYSPNRDLWAIATDEITGIYKIQGDGAKTKIVCIGSLSLGGDERVESVAFNATGDALKVVGKQGTVETLVVSDDGRVVPNKNLRAA